MVTASDGENSASNNATFVVVTPNEAIARLRADLTEKYADSSAAGFGKSPPYCGPRHLKCTTWSLATRELKSFVTALAAPVPDELLSARWDEAAGAISKYAVRRLPRGFRNSHDPRPISRSRSCDTRAWAALSSGIDEAQIKAERPQNRSGLSHTPHREQRSKRSNNLLRLPGNP